MKAFIAVSYKHSEVLKPFIKAVVVTLQELNIKSVVFVWKKEELKPKRLMKLALAEIASSDLLIADITFKSIGVGIELGYAFALGKKIIYLRKSGVELSTTASGISNVIIEYSNESELKNKLSKSISTLNFR